MKYTLASVVFLLTLCSCKEDTNIIDGIKSSIHESTSEVQKLDFNKTKFKDRAEELMYIREYIKQELPEKLMREQPKGLRDAQYYYMSMGKDYTLHETAVKIVDTIKATQAIMITVMQKELSLNETKELIKNTDLRKHKFVGEFDATTESNHRLNTDMQHTIKEKELIKIYPNIRNNFTEYHTEYYASSNKQIKLIYKIEHIPTTEMVVNNGTEMSGENEFQEKSVDGTFISAGTNYYIKGEYVGEGSFEGVAYNVSGGVYGTVSWRYMYDNSISLRVETEESSKDYDLAFVAKSTTVKSAQ